MMIIVMKIIYNDNYIDDNNNSNINNNNNKNNLNKDIFLRIPNTHDIRMEK